MVNGHEPRDREHTNPLWRPSHKDVPQKPEKAEIIIVFRDCLECGQPIGCLASSNEHPSSCEEHS